MENINSLSKIINLKNRINIVVAKIGKSILFDKNKWGTIGGDEEMPILITTLAQTNPHINFHIIGRSDFNKISPELRDKINIHKNIFYVQHPILNDKKIKYKIYYKYVYEHFKKYNIKIDFGIIWWGPTGSINIPDLFFDEKRGKYKQPLDMFLNYSSQIVYFLNESKIPYVAITNDEKFIPANTKDLFNRPIAILCSNEFEKETYYYNNYNINEKVYFNEKILNMNSDKYVLSGEYFMDINKIYSSKKDILIGLYSNGNGGGRYKKFNVFEKWIFTKFNKNDWIVYGKWEDDILNEKILCNENYKNNFINKPMSQLSDELYRTKYTLMVPGFMNKEIGNVSAKTWKMIYFGIIPFFHNLSDPKRTQLDLDILHPKDENEFFNNLMYLENNKNEYLKVLKYCLDKININYFNGTYINSLLFKYLNEYTNIDKKELEKIGSNEIEFKYSHLFNIEKNKQQIKYKQLSLF